MALKYIIWHNGYQIGQMQAPSLEDANEYAREVFGEDVYCEIENTTEKDLSLEK